MADGCAAKLALHHPFMVSRASWGQMSRMPRVTGLSPRVPCAVAALAGAVALAAATSCRRFQPAPLSPTDSARALESRSLADPELRALFERVLPGGAPRWPIEKWDLGTLTVAALYHNPSLEAARAKGR